ncbi:ferric reductase like transmembrane component [Hyaloscypha sp. PMI_1271]|nr:ferric reductase like transmembrane component [Hyaloscypha sp. PMI_1271]
MASTTPFSGPNPTIEPFTKDLKGVDQNTNSVDERLLWGSLGLLATVCLIVRAIDLVHRHLRHLSAMSATEHQQGYWAKSESTWLPQLKKQILYAPLRKKRHNKEIQISSATNFGTLPSRLHTAILSLYLLSNLAYCAGINYHVKNRYESLAQLRGRAGSLAVANMITLVILAGRNNPLIPLLRVSFDTYNLIHRWIGRMVVVEMIIHVAAWATTEVASDSWGGVVSRLHSDLFLQYGAASAVAMALLFLISPSVIRHAFYETFLNVHIALVIVAFVGILVHCDIGQLPQLPYIALVVVLWICDRLARLIQTLLVNSPRRGRRWTTATLQPLPGDTCRVKLHLPTRLVLKPGCHAYLRFSIRPWESHPFSIAWFEHVPLELTLPSNARPKNVATTTDVSFVIRARTGLTRHLYITAASSPGTRILASFEGPYGGCHALSSYGSCLHFAGASGITYQLSLVRHLVTGYVAGTVATRRIKLVWIIADLEFLSWIQPWLDHILGFPCGNILHIEIFVTRSNNLPLAQGADSRVVVSAGRPNVDLIIEQQVSVQIGAMCVSVCGPGSLADDVRKAVRAVQDVSVVDFVEECFTW